MNHCVIEIFTTMGTTDVLMNLAIVSLNATDKL